MTRDSGISNRLTPEDEARDRAEHPPQDAPPNTAGDAPGAVAGAFGAPDVSADGPDGLPGDVDDEAVAEEDELDDEEDELDEDDDEDDDEDEEDDDEEDDDDEADVEPTADA